MWARHIEDRRRGEERRWLRAEGPARRRHPRGFDEMVARREYAALHGQIETPLIEGSGDELLRWTDRLRNPRVGIEEKKQLLVLLAHRRCPSAQRLLARYAASPERGLEWFARLALEEAERIEASGCCQMTRQAPCPCGSAQKLKDCCGREP